MDSSKAGMELEIPVAANQNDFSATFSDRARRLSPFSAVFTESTV
jgi:hypothetical protein